jgi:hypothetical protein
VDVKGPTHGWRCGATRMLECQNASDVCTAKSQDNVRMRCARRPWQEMSCTAGGSFPNCDRGLTALPEGLAYISAFDASRPAQLLDPARAIKTRWAIDRQPRQLQQDAVIVRTLSGCFCGVQRAPVRVTHRDSLADGVSTRCPSVRAASAMLQR